MTIRRLQGLREIAAGYDGLVLDLWGVLHDGQRPFPDVVPALTALKQAGKRLAILSNAPRRAALVEARMNEIGLAPGLYDHVHSSGEETWQHLRRRDDAFYAALGRRCYHIGPTRDDNMLEGAGLTRVASLAESQFILNTGPSDWDETVAQYEPLLQEALARGLPMVCANPDLVVIHHGRRSICAGAVAERYEALGGTVRWHGKPMPGVYHTVFQWLGVADKRRVLAVGDSLRTDIAGANNAGIDSVLVLTGIHAEELSAIEPHALAEALGRHGDDRPTAVIDHFRW